MSSADFTGTIPSGFEEDPPPSWQPRLLGLLRLASAILAIGYAAGLVVAVLALRFVGERWWVTTALLYLPRIGFALPLPVVVLGLAIFGPRRWLWGLPVALALILFPLMGLQLGLGALVSPTARAADRPSFKLFSYNVATAHDPPAIVEVIREANPDVVVLQEYEETLDQPLAEAFPSYHHRHDGQFAVASRFPIGDVYLPPKIVVAGSADRSARFVRYRLDTPLGPIDLYNVHPVSPRNGLEEARGAGVLYELRRGHLGRTEGLAVMKGNSVLRELQAETIVTSAATSPGALIIAGDTNLPELSWILARTLSRYSDGFSAVGRGLGYTFPTQRPWMRIDRVFVNDRLAFHRFDVLRAHASDHLPVMAEIVAR